MSARLPLHLGARAEVALDAGPSLVVRVPGCADLRAPLARCSRVVAHAAARVEGEAIVACLRAGVPWVWVDNESGTLGACLPARCDPMDWRERVLTLLSRPDWRERYAGWLAAQRRMARLSLGERFGFHLDEPREAVWFSAFWAHVGARAKWSNWAMRRWSAMGAALALECWAAADAPADAICEPAEGWMPVLDAGGCAALDMAADLAARRMHWKRVRACPLREVEIELVRAFEARRRRLERISGKLLLRFQRWLMEMQSWR